MKNDLIKLILLVWMCGTIYFMYNMWSDLSYMVDLVSAYIKMIVEYSRN